MHTHSVSAQDEKDQLKLKSRRDGENTPLTRRIGSTQVRRFALPLSISLALLMLVSGATCAPIDLGSSSSFTPNDLIPSGLVVSQGSFTSLNGKTVSGTVSIYQAAGSLTSFTIRLEGLSVPNESGLMVVAAANGAEVISLALRFYSGTQNYAITVPAGAGVWNYVVIRSAVTTLDYGKAVLLRSN